MIQVKTCAVFTTEEQATPPGAVNDKHEANAGKCHYNKLDSSPRCDKFQNQNEKTIFLDLLSHRVSNTSLERPNREFSSCLEHFPLTSG